MKHPYRLRYPIPTLVLLGMLMVGVIAYRGLATVTNVVETDMRSHATWLGDHIANELAYKYARGEKLQADRFISDISTDSYLISALVCNENGRVLASSDTKLKGQFVVDTPSHKAAKACETMLAQIEIQKDNQQLEGIFPFRLNPLLDEMQSSRVGLLYLRFDLHRQIETMTAGVIIRTGLMGVVVLLLLLIVWHYMDRVLSFRVNSLVTATREIAASNLSARVELDGSDELTLLGKALNEMADVVQVQNDALRETEAQFRELSENIDDVFWISAPDMTKITYVSPAYEKMWGRLPSDLYKNPQEWTEAIHPDDRARVWDSFRQLSPEVPSVSVDFRVVRPDGTTRWVQDRGYQVPDSFGSVRHIAGVATDITDALNTREQRLNNLLSSTPAAIYTRHAFGDFAATYVSENVQMQMGYRPDDFVHNAAFWISNVHSDDKERVLAGQSALYERGSHSHDYRFLHQDGNYRWIHDTMRLLCDADGEPSEIIGFWVDITANKLADEEREKLLIQLAQSQKMESMGQLAGGVAHDYNNMLSVILGNVELALTQLDPTNILYDDLIQIQQAAKRSADLTRQLLAFARKQKVMPVVQDINSTLPAMLNMLRRLIGEHIELTWQPCADLWPVYIDPSQIDQLLVNLCVNARDAIVGIGHINIAIENRIVEDVDCASTPNAHPGEYISMSVSDTGSGIDDETLAHLFEPFFTTKGTGQGTGLGLATVYGIVMQNNGFITVDSSLNYGTTFNIFLPRYLGITEQDANASCTIEPRHGSETVLLVEDDQSVLNICKRMMQHEEYHVMVATSPDEAIRVAAAYSGDIHLLITDVIMPDMNGSDLAKRLLTMYPKMKCLFVSGYTADIIAQQGVVDAELNFMQKPYTMQSLTAKARAVLSAKSHGYPVNYDYKPDGAVKHNLKS